MNDWIGLAFFIVAAAGAFLGLRYLSRREKSTEAEFERRASEGASLLSAGVNALQGMLQPEDGRAKEAVREFREERSESEAKAGEEPDKNIGRAKRSDADPKKTEALRETGEK